MKPELWLNRADHELNLAQELLDAGSLLWAVSYAHRSVEYALEGFIFMKTGIRPEKGSRIEDLQAISRDFLPDAVNSAISDLTLVSPVIWQADVKKEQIRFLTDARARTLVQGARETLSWIGEVWNGQNTSDEINISSHPSGPSSS